jgi:hypothetical protein
MNRSLDLGMITNQRLPATTNHSPELPTTTRHSLGGEGEWNAGNPMVHSPELGRQ